MGPDKERDSLRGRKKEREEVIECMREKMIDRERAKKKDRKKEKKKEKKRESTRERERAACERIYCSFSLIMILLGLTA